MKQHKLHQLFVSIHQIKFCSHSAGKRMETIDALMENHLQMWWKVDSRVPKSRRPPSNRSLAVKHPLCALATGQWMTSLHLSPLWGPSSERLVSQTQVALIIPGCAGHAHTHTYTQLHFALKQSASSVTSSQNTMCVCVCICACACVCGTHVCLGESRSWNGSWQEKKRKKRREIKPDDWVFKWCFPHWERERERERGDRWARQWVVPSNTQQRGVEGGWPVDVCGGRRVNIK